MNNRPIKMLGATVDVQPYAPLLQDDGEIDGLYITGFPTELTEDFIAAHLENMVTMSAAGASAGPKGGQKGHMPPRSDHKAYLAPRKKKLIFDLMTPKSS